MTYGAPAAPGDLTQPQGSTAVFVDASGRRWRRIRWLGITLAGLLVAYLVLLAAALMGPPALSRISVPGLGPVLPGPGAAPLGDGRGGAVTPREALVQPAPEPVRTGGTTERPPPAGGAPVTTAPATDGPAPAAPAAPVPPAAPATSRPTPSASPSPAAAPPGQSTGRPTPSREPAPASTGGRPTEQPRPGGGRPSGQPGQAEGRPDASGSPSP